MSSFISAPPEHLKKERNKARILRQSQWWKRKLSQQLCYYCEQKFSIELLTMDHLIPIVRGGHSEKNNVVVSCKNCNTKKGHKLSHEV